VLEEQLLLARVVAVDDVAKLAGDSPGLYEVFKREVGQEGLTELGDAENAGGRGHVALGLLEKVSTGSRRSL
jgi:hypothetical protein